MDIYGARSWKLLSIRYSPLKSFLIALNGELPWFWWLIQTVDERNFLHQLIATLSHHLQGFIHPRWWSSDFWTINKYLSTFPPCSYWLRFRFTTFTNPRARASCCLWLQRIAHLGRQKGKKGWKLLQGWCPMKPWLGIYNWILTYLQNSKWARYDHCKWSYVTPL